MDCGALVSPGKGFIKKSPTDGGWVHRHNQCVRVPKVFEGEATQPVREPETRVCVKCDRHRPTEQFKGFKVCQECRK